MAQSDLAGMLSSVLSNPDAMGMLTSLLSGVENPSEGEEIEAKECAEEALEVGHHEGKARCQHRRELLSAIRPYLSHQRCATLDRMLRALELYELIEQTELLKGRR